MKNVFEPPQDTVDTPALSARCCVIEPLQLPKSGSRRRRLWELDGHSHCPVLGVCVPMDTLRRLMARLPGLDEQADDYAMHCSAVTECRTRTALAETVQRELERRFALQVRQAAASKSTDALAAWWRDRSKGAGLAGALWATLTHPRCDAALEHRVLGEVHMRQHQVGAQDRVDVDRHAHLVAQHARARAELEELRAQQHTMRAQWSARLETAEAEVVQLRADLIARDTAIHGLREQLARLRDSVPALRSREALTEQVSLQSERIAALLRDLEAARAQISALQVVHAQAAQAEPEGVPQALGALDLRDRAVLCVGGHTAVVPLYRRVVESFGARFAHHDGGEEHTLARLDAGLEAADLVVCQTGCISHNAYWRVKAHCKRTGKRCVFVESASAGSLQRALAETNLP
jgi:hypothetical protein